MKASVIHEYGEPEVMQVEDRANPMPGRGEVLVRLFATSVNPFDLYRRSGAVKEQAPIAFPGVVGVDIAGIVQALGEGVEEFAVGDEVFAMGDQTYAELCVVSASSLVRIPQGMDRIEAAAIPLVTTTGNMLAQAVGAKSGQTVLVTGAAGNVGRSAVYAFKAQGVFVIAGVLASQIEHAADLGADQFVATDSPEAIAALPVLDSVADTVAGSTAEKLIAKVRPGGTFGTVLYPPSNAKSFPQVTCVEVQAVPNAGILKIMSDAVVAGELTIPLGQRFPLSEAAAAHTAVAAGTARGKVILVVDPDSAATAEATAKIKTLLGSYNAALNQSDTDRVISLYTQDGIFMAPFSQSAIGPQAIRKAYDNVFSTRTFDVAFHLVELVVLSPGYAYARTNSAGHTTSVAKGEQSSEGNQELFVFRTDPTGVWKIARYSFSPTGHSAI
ncbi:MAG: SgcJ/EcaC family oxidoreductase [Janthinobacterium lividum]